MANILGSNKSYLSAYLNHHKNISFNDLLNRYRVEEICRLLSRTENDPFTFEYLAEQCGFRSRSTFYMAFKKFAGMSPATYRNHLRKTGR
jgi:AraC-like DNA-binding protein